MPSPTTCLVYPNLPDLLKAYNAMNIGGTPTAIACVGKLTVIGNRVPCQLTSTYKREREAYITVELPRLQYHYAVKRNSLPSYTLIRSRTRF